MKRYQGAGLATGMLVFTLAASPVNAQEAAAVEVTPFVALGSNGWAPIGAAITFPVTDNLSVETEVNYRRAESRINAFSMHGSLLYALPRLGRTTAYVVGGVGLSQYGAPVLSPSSSLPVGAEPRVTLSVNAGGGLKVPLDDKLELRTDGRWFKTFGRHASEHFRVAQGISFDVRKR